MGQREYNPKTGVFLSPDQGGSDQAYGYASGNPVSFSDLSGMDDVDGTLTDVSKISGWASTGALLAAVGCTLYRPCAPAVPIFMQVSAATGMLSAGSAGVLDSKACVVKGNCSGLVADVAIAAVASRLPGIGKTARNAAISRGSVGSSAGESATNVVNGQRLSNQLLGDEAAGIFTKSGGLQPAVINGSDPIIAGSRLGNQRVVQALTADGSKIEDWAKYSTKTFKSPAGPFQVHFYHNEVTGTTNYDIDYKAIFNVAR
jgi:hypothetical protein